MVSGKVIQFRRGRHTIHVRHFLIEVEGSKSIKDAQKYIGKEVSWKSPAGRIINGKIAAPHGTKGVLRAIFERGVDVLRAYSSAVPVIPPPIIMTS